MKTNNISTKIEISMRRFRLDRRVIQNVSLAPPNSSGVKTILIAKTILKPVGKSIGQYRFSFSAGLLDLPQVDSYERRRGDNVREHFFKSISKELRVLHSRRPNKFKETTSDSCRSDGRLYQGTDQPIPLQNILDTSPKKPQFIKKYFLKFASPKALAQFSMHFAWLCGRVFISFSASVLSKYKYSFFKKAS